MAGASRPLPGVMPQLRGGVAPARDLVTAACDTRAGAGAGSFFLCPAGRGAMLVPICPEPPEMPPPVMTDPSFSTRLADLLRFVYP